MTFKHKNEEKHEKVNSKRSHKGLTKVELFTFLHGKTIFVTLETIQYLGTGWDYTHTHTHRDSAQSELKRMGSYLKKMKSSIEREIYWEEKGEMEWAKLSLIKEASKGLISGGIKRGGERKHEVYSHHIPLKERIKCTLILV